MANLQLNESYFLPDPKEAILIAREGAEVDKCESLKVILARLDASKNQMLLPQPSPPEELHQSQHGMASTDAWSRKAGTRTLSSTMTVGKRSEIGQLGRVIHPKRFAYGRSHGNFFQSSPGLLPYRDLTIWEQHKAITPERSWSESAMRCLSPVGQCLASGFPQHPLEGGGQMACAFNSSCEFYSYWSAGPRSRLCRITSSCQKLVHVEQKSEVVKVYQRIVPATSQLSYMQLMGMYDSGTNLMLATLAGNFPLCCQQARRPDISGLQVPAAPHGRCLAWATPEKHVNPLKLLGTIQGNKTKYWNPELWDFRERHRIVVVAMVRDPLSQLQSWRKAPYGMERCAKRKRCPFSGATADCASKTAWLTEPCQFFDGTDGPPGAGIIGGAFGSLPGIWNAYTWGYVRLQEEAGYKSVFLVRFEDLVTDPVGIIQRISVAMEMTIEDAAIKVMEGVAKDHGEAKNRSTEMRSLESRTFMKAYSLPELKAACVRLNFSLAQKVGYPLQECQVFKDEAIAEAPIDEDHKRVEMEEKRSRFRSRYIRPPRTRGVLRTRPKTAGK